MRILVVLLTLLLLSSMPVGPKTSNEVTPVRAASERLDERPGGSGESSEEDLKEFVPSEQIRADHAISFPVDI